MGHESKQSVLKNVIQMAEKYCLKCPTIREHENQKYFEISSYLSHNGQMKETKETIDDRCYSGCQERTLTAGESVN